jgi:hypothetical protein
MSNNTQAALYTAPHLLPSGFHFPFCLTAIFVPIIKAEIKGTGQLTIGLANKLWIQYDGFE